MKIKDFFLKFTFYNTFTHISSFRNVLLGLFFDLGLIFFEHFSDDREIVLVPFGVVFDMLLYRVENARLPVRFPFAESHLFDLLSTFPLPHLVFVRFRICDLLPVFGEECSHFDFDVVIPSILVFRIVFSHQLGLSEDIKRLEKDE